MTTYPVLNITTIITTVMNKDIITLKEQLKDRTFIKITEEKKKKLKEIREILEKCKESDSEEEEEEDI